MCKKIINVGNIVLTLLSVYIPAASQNPWVHYIPKGYNEIFDMKDIVACGNDVLISGEQLISFRDSEILTCSTAPSTIILPLTAVYWFQPRRIGEVWLFTSPGGPGLLRYSLPALQPLEGFAASEMPPGRILSTVETRDSIIFATTVQYGVYTCNGLNWVHLEGSPVESNLRVRHEDRDGNIWFSGTGVTKYDRKENAWTTYTTDNSALTTNNITKIIDDKEGNIVVATDLFAPTDSQYNNGIFVLRGTTWMKYDMSSTGMPSNDVLCMARDSTGNIWFGSRMGVFKWDGKIAWENMCKGSRDDVHQPIGFIQAITVDAKNRVWVGTFHLGVYMIDENHPQCAAKLKVTNPLTSSTFKPSGGITVTWEYEGAPGYLKLEYRSGAGEWILIKNNIENFRKTLWNYKNLPPSQYYQVKLSSVGNPALFDTSAYFTIADSGVNIPPEIMFLPDTLLVKKNEQTTLTIHASDPDRDTLKFTYTNLPSWTAARDSVLTFEAVTGSESFTFTVTVSDGKGGAAVDSVKVVVDPSTGSVAPEPAGGGSSYPLAITMTSTSLLLTPTPGTTIRSGVLYSLAGERIGEFSSAAGRCTLNRKPGGATAFAAILRVNVADAAGGTSTISRLLLWQ